MRPARTTLNALLALALGVALAAAPGVRAADPAKVLRLATNDIDTLDPQQWQDRYSVEIGSSIFEGLYEWGYLGRPPSPVPNTAVALPEISADGRTWTMRVKPGIHFTDDPAFRGKPRELTAEDYVYSIKRALDPNLRGGGAPLTTDIIVGMRAVVDAARRPGAKLDYDAPVAGLRALDRHTLQLTLTEPNYPLVWDLLMDGRAVAREVVEAAGGDIQARAVGTGPYRLKEWKRGTRVVLEANPGYRTLAFPDSADPAHAAMVRAMKGRRLPQVGVIEFSVIEEQQTRLLEFDRGTLDFVELKGDGAQRLLKDGELDPALAARGIRRQPYPLNSVRSAYFNMDDPVVGGMGKERVALRRAIALAFDVGAFIRVVYAGEALPASQLIPPGVAGFDPAATRPPFDPALAQALLDRTGWGRRDAQGYRLAPDGRPLTLVMTTFTGTVWREMQTLWKKNMDAIGLRMEFRSVPTQDLFKEGAQGKYQINVHGRGSGPMGLSWSQLFSREPPELNDTRFRSDAFDRAYLQYLRTPPGGDLVTATRTMSDIARAHVPVLPLIVDVENAFSQPWVEGYHRSPFATYFKYVDIDVARKRQAGR